LQDAEARDETAALAYRFSAERRKDLARLGVIEAQIAELEAVLPGCHILIEDHSPLTDSRDELERLITALGDVQRVFETRTKAGREALNRWQMAAHERGHPLGSDPEFPAKLDLATLVDAARAAKQTLGFKQRRSHAADPEPIRRIADALALGWAQAHTGWYTPRYRMPPRKFREIVQMAYETMGAERDYLPERALRSHRAWQKLETAKRAAEREKTGCVSSDI
jgi:hypothetical protein